MFKSKYFNIAFLLVMGLFFITSCTKENVTTTKVNEGDIDPPVRTEQNALMSRSNANSQTNGLDFDCFFVVYPFDLVDDQGTTYTIADDTDFENLFLDSSIYIVDFVYPVNLEYEDGTTAVANDANELGEAFATCLPNGWNNNFFPAYVIDQTNSCFTLVYPISVQDDQGVSQTANNESELVNLISQDIYFFVFPFDLADDLGNVTTVNDPDELFFALASCGGGGIDSSYYGSGFEYIGCYQIIFPFTVVLSDGTTEVVNNHMEYCDLLLEGKVVGFDFPLTLLDIDSTQIIVNSQQELDQLLLDCGEPPFLQGDLILLYAGTIDSIFQNPCWDINFPIQANELDSAGTIIQTVNLNTIQELEALTPLEAYGIVYPVSVTYLADNRVATFQNIEDLFIGLSDCQ